MADIEKAINDLEEIKGKLIPAIARMYGSGFSSVFACEKVEEKIDNALELLKEKQPRVLTFDEAIQSEYEVLIEIYSPISEKTYIKWCDLCYDGNMSLAMYTTHGIQLISEESYNRLWRVWTDRPTDEQRKAVPWKGGEKK